MPYKNLSPYQYTVFVINCIIVDVIIVLLLELALLSADSDVIGFFHVLKSFNSVIFCESAA